MAGNVVYDRSRVWEFVPQYESKDKVLEEAQMQGKSVSRRTVFRRLKAIQSVAVGRTVLIPRKDADWLVEP